MRCRSGDGRGRLVLAGGEHDHGCGHGGGPGGERAHEVTAALAGLPRRLKIPQRALRRDRGRKLERPRQVAGQQHGRAREPTRARWRAPRLPPAGVRSRIVSSSVSGAAPRASRLRARRTARGRSTDRKAVHSRFRPGIAARPAARRGERPVAPPPAWPRARYVRHSHTGQYKPKRGDPQKRRREGPPARGAAPLRRRVHRGRHGPRSLCGRTRKSGVCLSPAPEKAWGDGKDVSPPRKRRLWIGGFSA